ncbi:Anthranilate 1,2-dioxygenase electron transfer component [Corynebacterium provencense]|uniref:Anthranilate 1,2-dioxygenase electron transfer component n=1 Tax=Corynebacterium provencense TaxID=1737425 RepID=A0A2Z3YS40_9CORY|nr:hypothetical protein [Corynebacterium provencense]AWT27129.1 Anthranilate 1,2-dioxygenase electron transfer component [Corynebacterium provencense]
MTTDLPDSGPHDRARAQTHPEGRHAARDLAARGPRHSRTAGTRDLGTLSDAVNATYDRLDELVEATLEHWRRLTPPVADVPQPVTADGTAGPPHLPDSRWLLRAALVAADGLTFTASGTATFDREHTDFLADLGRDLRKDGVTVDHYAAAAEALGRALCQINGLPYPGADLTYKAAEAAGLPEGLTELLQTLDLGVRITALGAVEDEDAGIPAASDAEVLEVQRRSPRVTVVRLQATPAPTWWAGQFLQVRTPSDPGKWWSAAPSVAPDPSGLLEFAVFHPAGEPLSATVGEHWVVANPTGALDMPRQGGTPVVMLALGAGLSPLRSLILATPDRDTAPPVHLYWQVNHRSDLHEYTGLLGLARAFDRLTFTPVVTDGEDATADDDAAWFADGDRGRFLTFSGPGPELAAAGRPLRRGTAAGVAVEDLTGHPDGQGTSGPGGIGGIGGVRFLVAGDPSNPGGAAEVREAVRVLTDAGADPALVTAEPL